MPKPKLWVDIQGVFLLILPSKFLFVDLVPPNKAKNTEGEKPALNKVNSKMMLEGLKSNQDKYSVTILFKSVASHQITVVYPHASSPCLPPT
jgi:hypothetical protein